MKFWNSYVTLFSVFKNKRDSQRRQFPASFSPYYENLNQSDSYNYHLNFTTRCFFALLDFELFCRNGNYSIPFLRIFIRQINIVRVGRTFLVLRWDPLKIQNLAKSRPRTQTYATLSAERGRGSFPMIFSPCIRRLKQVCIGGFSLT